MHQKRITIFDSDMFTIVLDVPYVGYYLNMARYWLIEVLAGTHTIVINAKIKNGTLHLGPNSYVANTTIESISGKTAKAIEVTPEFSNLQK